MTSSRDPRKATHHRLISDDIVDNISDFSKSEGESDVVVSQTDSVSWQTIPPLHNFVHLGCCKLFLIMTAMLNKYGHFHMEEAGEQANRKEYVKPPPTVM